MAQDVVEVEFLLAMAQVVRVDVDGGVVAAQITCKAVYDLPAPSTV